MNSAVVIQNLHKRFGSQVVLKGIDLKVEQGETVAVLGRSGTGKSVLLKLIIGLQKPDTGSIQIHGQDITDLVEPAVASYIESHHLYQVTDDH